MPAFYMLNVFQTFLLIIIKYMKSGVQLVWKWQDILLFSTVSVQVQSCSTGTGGLSLEVEWLDYEADHSPLK
jgi:hypothetical protein